MDIISFCRQAHSAANRYYDYLKSVSRGGETIYITSIEHMGRKKVKLSISKKIFNQDSVELRISSPHAPLTIQPEDLNIVEYNETNLYIIITTTQQLYDVLLRCSPTDVVLFSDMTFLIKATRNFYRDFHDFIAYPPAPNMAVESISRPLGASDEQYNSICSVFSNPVSYVWGAPGTGKTQMVLANCMIQYINAGKSVLLIAPTNNALEQSLRGIIKVMDLQEIPHKRMIRLGRASTDFLLSYPDVCESNQYETIVEMKAKELERLRDDLQRHKRRESIFQNHQRFLLLLDEYNEQQSTVDRLHNGLDEAHKKLCQAQSDVKSYQATKDALLDRVTLLTEQEKKQKRYLLFVDCYIEYRQLIEQYHANVEKLLSERAILEEDLSVSRVNTAHIQEERQTKSTDLHRYKRENNTLPKKIKRFFSRSMRQEYNEFLLIQSNILDTITRSLEEQTEAIEQTVARISSVNARIEQENSIKVGHPALFEISQTLYDKILPFDSLTEALTAELEQFKDFRMDHELDDKLSDATQKCETITAKIDTLQVQIHDLQVSLLKTEHDIGEAKEQLEHVKARFKPISMAIADKNLPIDQLAEAFDGILETYSDLASPADLAELIVQKEQEYQAFVVKMQDILSQKQVIACTLDYAIIHFNSMCEGIAHSISHVFVDEAAYCPLIKAGLFFSFHVPVALFGDHMQLPPICEMDRRSIISTYENQAVFMFDMSAIYFADIFEDDIDEEALYQTYLYNKPPSFGLVAVTFLTKTFRFGQKLAAALDEHIYHQGFCGNEIAQTEVIVIDAPRGTGNSELRSSRSEARAIGRYLSEAKPDDYIILAPYRAQCRTIEQELRLPIGSVLTVHASQGREWDTVIISVTDAHKPFFMSSQIAKSNGINIINTAFSRTRRKLVLVLDYECWAHAEGELIRDIILNL